VSRKQLTPCCTLFYFRVLVSTSCVFVFLFAVVIRVERFRWAKLAGVLLAYIGTALTTMNDLSNDDPDDNSNVLLGDILSLLAAVGYAVYTVQARVICPQDEELMSMQLLLGYVGIICVVPLLPIAIYSATQVNITWQIVGILMGKGLLDFVITDYLLFRSVILTNATVASVGLGLTIPLAFLADWILDKLGAVSAASICGAVAIALGFLIVNLTGENDNEEHKEPLVEGESSEEKANEEAGVAV